LLRSSVWLISTASLNPSSGLTHAAYQPSSLLGAFIPYGNRYLILREASHLYAFSAYPFRTWLPSDYPWQDNWKTRGSSLPVLSY